MFGFFGGRHVPEETREAEYVPAFRHPWGHGRGQTNGTASHLGLLRGEDLEDEIPGEVDIRVDGLGTVIAAGIHEEAVVCIYKAATDN